jgi:hypothetical protein
VGFAATLIAARLLCQRAGVQAGQRRGAQGQYLLLGQHVVDVSDPKGMRSTGVPHTIASITPVRTHVGEDIWQIAAEFSQAIMREKFSPMPRLPRSC